MSRKKIERREEKVENYIEGKKWVGRGLVNILII